MIITDKTYFKNNVKLVEIETFSYCNRQCWHCPNSIIDRHSGNTYMSDFVYNKILKNLKQIKYDKIVSFGRYNEPLADSIIYKRIQEAKKALPNAILHFNTNGDFLNTESLEKIYNAGLKSLAIQVYLQDNKNIKQKIEKKMTSLNLMTYTELRETETKIEYITTYKDMNVSIYWRDFKKTGINRGGIIEKLNRKPERIVPCLMPSSWVCIDYNGSVMPCCNLRSDWEDHKKFILGNLNDKNRNLFNIFNSKEAVKFRQLLASNELKPYPCNTCHFSERRI